MTWTVPSYGCLNCFVTTISAEPGFVIELKSKLTIPDASANWASTRLPF